MLLLALDTSTPAVSAAVHDGDRVLAQEVVVDARRHGELLAPVVARVLDVAGAQPRQLTGIVVGVGPGPYTGLRVGVVTALAMGAALDVPVVGACSLDAFVSTGLGGAGGAPFAVVTDARRREVYWARYDASGARTAGPAVDTPAEVASRLTADGVVALGPATELYAFDPTVPSQPLSAGALASLVVAGVADELPVRPLYLRRPDAIPPGRPKAVLL